MKATEEMIVEAIDILRGKEYPIAGPWSIVTPVRIIIGKKGTTLKASTNRINSDGSINL
jgi:hypothetical protein